MLKGHVFINQNFGNQIFALFINTFLAGNNGIINGYKNSMGLTVSGSQVTVASGALCVQGRFLEEDSSTTLDAGTNDAYCKLVLTINLDRENTSSSFLQGYYEILTGVSDYPSLTQNNIVGTNEGMYQFELARFRTGLSGITNFVDKRTYLDFNSIYAELANQSILLHKSGGTMTGTIVSQDIVPKETNLYDLGSADARFNMVYLNKLKFNNEHAFSFDWMESGDLNIMIDNSVRAIPVLEGHSMKLRWDAHGLAVLIDHTYVGHITLTPYTPYYQTDFGG